LKQKSIKPNGFLIRKERLGLEKLMKTRHIILVVVLVAFTWFFIGFVVGSHHGKKTVATTQVATSESPESNDYVSGSAKNPTKKWHTETLVDNEYFSRDYWIDGCVVYVHKDEGGITINATDPDYLGEVLTQTITITKNKYGFVDERESHRLGNKTVAISYDVFAVNYLREARSLPDDIKKLFLGRYGIE